MEKFRLSEKTRKFDLIFQFTYQTSNLSGRLNQPFFLTKSELMIWKLQKSINYNVFEITKGYLL